MRALSITLLLIRVCIVWAVIWPDRIGAEENGPAAFRIEISQPEYGSQAGKAWTCLTAVLVRSPPECRQSVPLILFGRPILAHIDAQITVAPASLVIPLLGPNKRRAVVIHASLDQPRSWYRASGGYPDYFNLVLNTDDSLAKERIGLEYWSEKTRSLMDPVVRPSPDESLALKITPTAAR